MAIFSTSWALDEDISSQCCSSSTGQNFIWLDPSQFSRPPWLWSVRRHFHWCRPSFWPLFNGVQWMDLVSVCLHVRFFFVTVSDVLLRVFIITPNTTDHVSTRYPCITNENQWRQWKLLSELSKLDKEQYLISPIFCMNRSRVWGPPRTCCHTYFGLAIAHCHNNGPCFVHWATCFSLGSSKSGDLCLHATYLLLPVA